MTNVNLFAGLTMVALLAASPVLAQTSDGRTHTPAPALSSPGGVAGGFASSTDKDAATKQKAQNLTPSADQAAAEKANQK